MHISALFPMLCAIVAFVLSMLCLFAGSKPGFMEEYSIIMVRPSFHKLALANAFFTAQHLDRGPKYHLRKGHLRLHSFFGTHIYHRQQCTP